MDPIRLVPTWVPERTLEHIRENHEHHITREEIKEVVQRDFRNLTVVRSKKNHKSDVNVKGRTLDGKLLHLCVILDNRVIREWIREERVEHEIDPNRICSIVYNGWMINS